MNTTKETKTTAQLAREQACDALIKRCLDSGWEDDDMGLACDMTQCIVWDGLNVCLSVGLCRNRRTESYLGIHLMDDSGQDRMIHIMGCEDLLEYVPGGEGPSWVSLLISTVSKASRVGEIDMAFGAIVQSKLLKELPNQIVTEFG